MLGMFHVCVYMIYRIYTHNRLIMHIAAVNGHPNIIYHILNPSVN